MCCVRAPKEHQNLSTTNTKMEGVTRSGERDSGEFIYTQLEG